MKITLITCTYNAEDVLQRTLDSVLRQTYADIEHIIVDGKSQDATLSIAQQYKAQNDMLHTGHRVVMVSEPDSGLYDAMNKGIRMATGKYLCFLNAGDTLYDKDTIAEIARKAATREYAVVYGETDIVDMDGNFLRHRRLKAPEDLSWRSFREGMLVCHQAFYANTAIAQRVPYNLKYRVSSDFDWCIRIMKEGEREGLQTHNTHKVLCKYLAGGMSIQNHRASLLERFRAMSNHYGFVPTIILHIWFVVRGIFVK